MDFLSSLTFGGEDRGMPLCITTEREPAGTCLPEDDFRCLTPATADTAFRTKLLIYRLQIQLTFPEHLCYARHCARCLTSTEVDVIAPTLQVGKLSF